jgi:hypothetical protein
MAADKSVGRSEALRRSMVAMIDQGQPHEAHPAYWAPFVVVGEGGGQEPIGTAKPSLQVTGKAKAPPRPQARPNRTPDWRIEFWRQ